MTMHPCTTGTLLCLGVVAALAAHPQSPSRLGLTPEFITESAGGTPASAATSEQLVASYAGVPLHFEANRGQTDPRVQFLARRPGYTLFLTPNEVVLVPAAHRHTDTDLSLPGQSNAQTRALGRTPEVRMQFVGAQPQPSMVGVNKLEGRSQYFIGRESSRWLTDVPSYARVQYREIYPGIDLVFYGHQEQLEYDFVLAPGADPATIRLRFAGTRRVELDNRGDLVLHTPSSLLRLQKPIVYQQVNGLRRDIAAGFRLEGDHEVGFQIAAYDTRWPLIIDPVLVFSTYLGGSGPDASRAVAVDGSGSVYVVGSSGSIDFPVSAPAFQATYGGGSADAFVAKFNPAGTAFEYVTYLGGSGFDQANAIHVDVFGQVYVTGPTERAIPFHAQGSCGLDSTGQRRTHGAFPVRQHERQAHLLTSGGQSLIELFQSKGPIVFMPFCGGIVFKP